MKEYEVIWEIFNKCPRNQMRDVFVEEVEIEDPEEYIKKKFQGKEDCRYYIAIMQSVNPYRDET